MYGHMEIRTLFFASYKELLGTGELQVDLPEGATVSDLVSALRSREALLRFFPLRLP